MLCNDACSLSSQALYALYRLARAKAVASRKSLAPSVPVSAPLVVLHEDLVHAGGREVRPNLQLPRSCSSIPGHPLPMKAGASTLQRAWLL